RRRCYYAFRIPRILRRAAPPLVPYTTLFRSPAPSAPDPVDIHYSGDKFRQSLSGFVPGGATGSLPTRKTPADAPVQNNNSRTLAQTAMPAVEPALTVNAPTPAFDGALLHRDCVTPRNCPAAGTGRRRGFLRKRFPATHKPAPGARS